MLQQNLCAMSAERWIKLGPYRSQSADGFIKHSGNVITNDKKIDVWLCHKPSREGDRNINTAINDMSHTIIFEDNIDCHFLFIGSA